MTEQLHLSIWTPGGKKLSKVGDLVFRNPGDKIGRKSEKKRSRRYTGGVVFISEE